MTGAITVTLVIFAAAALPGYLLAAFTIDRIGRKLMQAPQAFFHDQETFREAGSGIFRRAGSRVLCAGSRLRISFTASTSLQFTVIVVDRNPREREGRQM